MATGTLILVADIELLTTLPESTADFTMCGGCGLRHTAWFLKSSATSMQSPLKFLAKSKDSKQTIQVRSHVQP